MATVKEGTKKREMLLDVEKYCLEKTVMLFSTKDFVKINILIIDKWERCLF